MLEYSLLRSYCFSMRLNLPIAAGVVFVLLGVGCTQSVSTSTVDTATTFSLKQKCESYIDSLQKTLEAESLPNSVSDSLDRVCYSRKFNTCVAFIEEQNVGDKPDGLYWAQDILANSSTLILLNSIKGVPYLYYVGGMLEASSRVSEMNPPQQQKQAESGNQGKQDVQDAVQCAD